MTQATKQQRWDLLLNEHRAALAEIIRLAAEHPRDHGLDACRAWAVRQQLALTRDARNPRLDQAFSAIGTWGQNGKGPAIRSQLHSARTFAELARRDAARGREAA